MASEHDLIAVITRLDADHLLVCYSAGVISLPVHSVAFRYDPDEKSLSIHCDHVMPPAILVRGMEASWFEKCKALLFLRILGKWKDEVKELSFYKKDGLSDILIRMPSS